MTTINGIPQSNRGVKFFLKIRDYCQATQKIGGISEYNF